MRGRGSVVGRKGEAALPLYKGKCAPVPIVCQADRQPWGAERERGGLPLSSQGFTSSMGGGREIEIQRQRLKG